MSKGSLAQYVVTILTTLSSSMRRPPVAFCFVIFGSGTHLSLNKDCPDPRSIQPPSAGKIVAFPEVGGLHHRHERRAACAQRSSIAPSLRRDPPFPPIA